MEEEVMKKKKFLSFFVIFFTTILTLYFILLPAIFSNDKLVSFICKNISKKTNYTIQIKAPELRCYPNASIKFEAGSIFATNNKLEILKIADLKFIFSFKNILQKKICLKELTTNSVFIDSTPFLTTENQTNNTNSSNWKIDLYDSNLSIDKIILQHNPNKNSQISIHVNNLKLENTENEPKYIHFDTNGELTTPDKRIYFTISDNNTIFIKNNNLYLDNTLLKINNSIINIFAEYSNEKDSSINLNSKSFNIKDLADIISTNIIIPDGDKIIANFKEIKGAFDFNLYLKNNSLQGDVNIKKGSFKIVLLNNLPIVFNKGKIQILPTDINLKDFRGFYGTNTKNIASLEGTIKDYLENFNANITIKTSLHNDFFKNYLSNIIGIPIEIEGTAGTKISINAKPTKTDISILTGLAKGYDFIVDGASLTEKEHDRAIKADLSLIENFLNIKNINYYTESELIRGKVANPVVVLKGQFDISKEVPLMRAFGFEIPKPLPSEFLNLLIGEHLFKRGNFAGKVYYVNFDGNPTIKGNLTAEKVLIPSQRLYIRDAKLNAKNELISINTNGRYKRSNFTFTGDIVNAIKYPITIKNLDFQLDKLDLEKLLTSLQQPVAETSNIEITNENEICDDNSVTFDFKNIIIEDSIFTLKEGCYKDINFGDLKATMTLNKNHILELKSNRFNFAEGISSLKVLCDFNNEKYSLKLAIKDINSDLISSTLLNLHKEISGKASGFINLNTDSSFKLNGKINFSIKDGQIPKIGLVEYLIRFTSVFRNPIVAISPTIFSDIIKVPEGEFKSINGEINIENNFVKLLKITTSSNYLSNYIVGCYNLENSDAILRIYTKLSNTSKGKFGGLRNISLSGIAKKIPLTSTNSLSYYSSELKNLPEIEAKEEDCQIFITTVDGDLEHNNFLSSLKKIK